MSHFQEAFWVGAGFDELHRYMKQGNELCKDLEGVLSDRADLEKDYSNGMHKIAKKAKKASKKCIGTLHDVWQKVIMELESEEEIHRTLSQSLQQDCAKPMKAFIDSQVKQREPIESSVEKQNRLYVDKMKQQMKAKKNAFKQCRDLELCWDQLEDVKSGKGKPMSEKDVHRLEKNSRKMEENLIRMDREYRDSNIKTEEARLAWESAMYRCCDTMEVLELERLQQVQSMLSKYCELVQSVLEPTQQACEDVLQVAACINPEGDVELACSTVGTGPNQPQQLLLDCYEEELGNHMKLERRRANLEKKIQGLEEDIDRQEKARKGIESLSKVYQEQPDFTDQKGAEDVSRQLLEMDAMLNMLKANHYKLLCAHAEISNAPRPTSHFSDYFETGKDKQGHTMTYLCISVEHISNVQLDSATGVTYSIAKKSKGASPPPYEEIDVPSYSDQLDDSDEFTGSQEGGGKLAFSDTQQANGGHYLSTCEVQYDYTANHEDELTIEPGDVINITNKQDQDWWEGELNGRVGIFPASYVQEL